MILSLQSVIFQLLKNIESPRLKWEIYEEWREKPDKTAYETTELDVMPLGQIFKKRHFKWCGHVYRVEEYGEPRSFWEARSTGKTPRLS